MVQTKKTLPSPYDIPADSPEQRQKIAQAALFLSMWIPAVESSDIGVRAGALSGAGELIQIFPEKKEWMFELVKKGVNSTKPVSRAALTSLGKIARVMPEKADEILDILRKGMRMNDWHVRQAAALGLGSAAQVMPEKADVIWEIMTTSMKDVSAYQQTAFASLGGIARAMPDKQDEILAILKRGMQHTDWYVQRAAGLSVKDIVQSMPNKAEEIFYMTTKIEEEGAMIGVFAGLGAIAQAMPERKAKFWDMVSKGMKGAWYMRQATLFGLEHMVQAMPDKAVEILDIVSNAMESSNSETQEGAVSVLGSLARSLPEKSEEIWKLMKRGMKDESSKVQQTAVSNLREIVRAMPEKEGEFLDMVKKGMTGTGLKSWQAAFVLGEMAQILDPTSLRDLWSYVEQNVPDPKLRIHAYQAVSHIADETSDKDMGIAAMIQSKSMPDILSDILPDSPEQRQKIAQAARFLGMWASAMESPDEDVRVGALSSLRELAQVIPEQRSWMFEMAKKGMEDDSARIWHTALLVLADMTRSMPDKADEIWEIVNKEIKNSDRRIRQTAILSLGSLAETMPGKSDEILEIVGKEINDDDWKIRKTAVSVLESMARSMPERSDDIWKMAIKAMEDEDGYVRQEAVVGLISRVMPEKAEEIWEIAKKAMQDDDWHKRQAIVSRLGDIARIMPDKAKKIWEMARKGMEDNDWRVRRAAASSLGDMVQTMPGNSSMIWKIASKGMEDAIWLVREAAFSSLGGIVQVMPKKRDDIWRMVRESMKKSDLYENRSKQRAVLSNLGDIVRAMPEKAEDIWEIVSKEMWYADPDTRRAAVSILGDIAQGMPEKTNEILEMLVKEMGSFNGHTRQAAASSLWDIAKAMPERADEILEIVSSKIQHGDRYVHQAVALSFGDMAQASDHASLRELWHYVQQNVPDPKLRIHAYQTVSHIADRTSGKDMAQDKNMSAAFPGIPMDSPEQGQKTAQAARFLSMWVDSMESSDENIKDAVLFSLGKLVRIFPEQGARMFEMVREGMGSDDWNARQAALSSLAGMAQVMPEKADEILNMVDEGTRDVFEPAQKAALSSLADIAKILPEKLGRILEIVNREMRNQRDPKMQQAAGSVFRNIALSMPERGEEIWETVIRNMKDDDRTVRNTAFLSLGSIARTLPEKAEEIWKLAHGEMKNNYMIARKAAFSNFGDIARVMPEKAEEIRKIVVEEIKDDDPHTRKIAFSILSDLAPILPEKAGEMLVMAGKGLEDKDSRVRMAAVLSLGHIAKAMPGSPEEILDMARKGLGDNFDDVRIAAFSILGNVAEILPEKADEILEIVSKGMKEDNWDLRHAAVSSLGDIARALPEKSEEILNIVDKGMEADEWQTQQASALSLGSIVPVMSDKSEKIWEMTEKAMRDPDMHEEQAILLSLGNIARTMPEKTGEILDMVSKSMENDDWSVQRTAIISLGDILLALEPESLKALWSYTQRAVSDVRLYNRAYEIMSRMTKESANWQEDFSETYLPIFQNASSMLKKIEPEKQEIIVSLEIEGKTKRSFLKALSAQELKAMAYLERLRDPALAPALGHLEELLKLKMVRKKRSALRALWGVFVLVNKEVISPKNAQNLLSSITKDNLPHAKDLLSSMAYGNADLRQGFDLDKLLDDNDADYHSLLGSWLKHLKEKLFKNFDLTQDQKKILEKSLKDNPSAWLESGLFSSLALHASFLEKEGLRSLKALVLDLTQSPASEDKDRFVYKKRYAEVEKAFKDHPKFLKAWMQEYVSSPSSSFPSPLEGEGRVRGPSSNKVSEEPTINWAQHLAQIKDHLGIKTADDIEQAFAFKTKDLKEKLSSDQVSEDLQRFISQAPMLSNYLDGFIPSLKVIVENLEQNRAPPKEAVSTLLPLLSKPDLMKHVLPDAGNTFTDIKNLNTEIKAFNAPKTRENSSPLRLEVTDDPSAMILMGAEPMPTCQNCKEEKGHTKKGELVNRLRLGQVKLANIYQENTLVARTVVEAGFNDKGKPALLVERLYTLPGKKLGVSEIESLIMSFAVHLKAETVFWGNGHSTWSLKNQKTQTKPYKLLPQRGLKIYRDSFGKDGGKAVSVPIIKNSKLRIKNYSFLPWFLAPAIALLAFLGIPGASEAASSVSESVLNFSFLSSSVIPAKAGIQTLFSFSLSLLSLSLIPLLAMVQAKKAPMDLSDIPADSPEQRQKIAQAALFLSMWIPAVESSDISVRAGALSGVGELIQIFPEKKQWMFELVKKGVNNSRLAFETITKPVSRAALTSLGKIARVMPEKADEILDILRKGMRMNDWHVRQAAALSLGSVAQVMPEKADVIWEIMTTSMKDISAYQQTAFASLGGIAQAMPDKQDEILAILKRGMQHTDWHVQKAAGLSLGDIIQAMPEKAEEIFDMAEKIRADHEDSLGAFAGLGGIVQAMPEKRADIWDMVNKGMRGAWYVRQATFFGLKHMVTAMPEKAEEIFDLVAKGMRSRNLDVQIAAASVLGSLAQALPEKSDEIWELAKIGVEDDAWKVRQSAISSLGQIVRAEPKRAGEILDLVNRSITDPGLEAWQDVLGEMAHLLDPASIRDVWSHVEHKVADPRLRVHALEAVSHMMNETSGKDTDIAVMIRDENTREAFPDIYMDSQEQRQEITRAARFLSMWIQASESADASIKVGALSASGKVAQHLPEEARPWMLEMVKGGVEDADQRVRQAAMLSMIILAQVIPERAGEIWEMAKDGMGDADWSVRRAAASTLGSMFKHMPERADEIWEMVKRDRENSDRDVRQAAILNLDSMVQHMPERAGEIWEMAKAGMEDDDWHVREAAALSLGSIARAMPEKSDEIFRVVKKGMRDDVRSVQEASALNLGDLAAAMPQKADEILKMVKEDAQDNSLYVQRAAVLTLGSLAAAMPENADEIWEMAKKSMGNNNWRVRQAAVSNLGMLAQAMPHRANEIWEMITREMGDDYWVMRYAAASALGSMVKAMPEKADEILEMIKKGVEDNSWDVRQAAVSALGDVMQTTNPSSLRALLDYTRQRVPRAKLHSHALKVISRLAKESSGWKKTLSKDYLPIFQGISSMLKKIEPERQEIIVALDIEGKTKRSFLKNLSVQELKAMAYLERLRNPDLAPSLERLEELLKNRKIRKSRAVRRALWGVFILVNKKVISPRNAQVLLDAIDMDNLSQARDFLGTLAYGNVKLRQGFNLAGALSNGKADYQTLFQSWLEHLKEKLLKDFNLTKEQKDTLGKSLKKHHSAWLETGLLSNLVLHSSFLNGTGLKTVKALVLDLAQSPVSKDGSRFVHKKRYEKIKQAFKNHPKFLKAWMQEYSSPPHSSPRPLRERASEARVRGTSADKVSEEPITNWPMHLAQIKDHLNIESADELERSFASKIKELKEKLQSDQVNADLERFMPQAEMLSNYLDGFIPSLKVIVENLEQNRAPPKQAISTLFPLLSKPDLMKHVLPDTGNTFQDIKNLNEELKALQAPKTPTNTSSLRLDVTDDPAVMILMGDEPMPTCQNYKEAKGHTRSGELVNRSRLGQIKLANIFQGGVLVARTVVEAGLDDKGKPALFVERLYTLPGKKINISEVESLIMSYAGHIRANTVYWGNHHGTWTLKKQKTQAKSYELLPQHGLSIYRDSFGKDGGEAPASVVAATGKNKRKGSTMLLPLIALALASGFLALLGLPEAASVGSAAAIEPTPSVILNLIQDLFFFPPSLFILPLLSLSALVAQCLSGFFSSSFPFLGLGIVTSAMIPPSLHSILSWLKALSSIDPKTAQSKRKQSKIRKLRQLISERDPKIWDKQVYVGTIGAGERSTWNPEGFSFPWGITLDGQGNIYVADTRANRIQMLDKNGERIKTIGTGRPTKSKNGFNGPVAAALDKRGNLYVSDAQNHRVQKFSKNGKYLGMMGTGKIEWGKEGFNGPHGIAVDSRNNIYIADSGNSRIQVFDENMEYIDMIGTGFIASDNNGFNSPHGIAVDIYDNVYVADTRNHRIQKFDKNWKYVSTIGLGTRTSRKKGLDSPYSIAVDKWGNIYVADAGNQRVQKFGKNGKYLSATGTGEDTARSEEFDDPNGVAVDADGDLYVADTSNHRIQSYALLANMLIPELLKMPESEWGRLLDRIETLIVSHPYFASWLVNSEDIAEALDTLENMSVAIRNMERERRDMILSQEYFPKTDRKFLKTLTVEELRVLVRLERLWNPSVMNDRVMDKLEHLLQQKYVRKKRSALRAVWGAIVLSGTGELSSKNLETAFVSMTKANMNQAKDFFNSLAFGGSGLEEDFDINKAIKNSKQGGIIDFSSAIDLWTAYLSKEMFEDLKFTKKEKNTIKSSLKTRYIAWLSSNFYSNLMIHSSFLNDTNGRRSLKALLLDLAKSPVSKDRERFIYKKRYDQVKKAFRNHPKFLKAWMQEYVSSPSSSFPSPLEGEGRVRGPSSNKVSEEPTINWAQHLAQIKDHLGIESADDIELAFALKTKELKEKLSSDQISEDLEMFMPQAEMLSNYLDGFIPSLKVIVEGLEQNRAPPREAFSTLLPLLSKPDLMKHVLPDASNTFTDIKNLNDEVKALSPPPSLPHQGGGKRQREDNSSLRLEVTDDPSVMLLMGAEPMPTCQDYSELKLQTGNGDLLNRLRLGQIKLANISQGDALVARTVVEAGFDDKGEPALFVERLYTLPGKKIRVSEIESLIMSFAGHLNAETVFWGGGHGTWSLKNQKTQTRSYKLLPQQGLTIYRDSFSKDGGKTVSVPVIKNSKLRIKNYSFLPWVLAPAIALLAFFGLSSIGEAAAMVSRAANAVDAGPLSLLSILVGTLGLGLTGVLGSVMPDAPAHSKEHAEKAIEALKRLNIAATDATAFFSPDSRFMVARLKNNTIKVFDLEAREDMEHLIGLNVRHVSFSLDSKFMIAYSGNLTARVFNLETRVDMGMSIDYAVEEVSFSPNNRFMAVRKLRGGTKVFDLEARGDMERLIGSDARRVFFSPDSRFIIVRYWDATVKVFDLEARKDMERLIGHDVRHASFSPDSRIMVARYEDETAKVFDLEAREDVEIPTGICVQEITFSPDSKFVIARYKDNPAKVFDLETRKDMGIQIGSNIWGISFSPDSRFIVGRYENDTAKVFDLEARNDMEHLIGPNVRKASFSSNGKFMAVIYKDNSAKAFDLEVREDMEHLIGSDARMVFLSPDGRFMAVHSENRTVKIFDLEARESVEMPIGHDVQHVTFSPDSKFMVARYENIPVKVFDLESFLFNPALKQGSKAWRESASFGFELLYLLIKKGIIQKKEGFEDWFSFLLEPIERINEYTTGYNRPHIFKLFQTTDILGFVLENGGDIKTHILFYVDIIRKNKRLALQALEGLFEAIRQGVVSIELSETEQKDILAFTRKTNSFNLFLYRMYQKEGEKGLAEAIRFGETILKDEAGFEEMAAFKQGMAQKGHDAEEVLLAVAQKAIPASGASFVSKGEIKYLFSRYLEAGDRRGDIPKALRKLGRFGGKLIRKIEWRLKKGEVFDPEKKVRVLISKMRYPDSGKDKAQKEKDMEGDRKRFVGELREYLSVIVKSAPPSSRRTSLSVIARSSSDEAIPKAPQAPEIATLHQKNGDSPLAEGRDSPRFSEGAHNNRSVDIPHLLNSFLSYARYNDQLNEKIDAIQTESYTSLDLLDQLFTDKDNLSVLLRKVIGIEFNNDGSKDITNQKKLLKQMKGIWDHKKLTAPEKKEKALRGLMHNYKTDELISKMLTEDLGPALRDAIEKILAQRSTLPIPPSQIIKDLFEEPIETIKAEKAKYKEKVSKDSINLKFQVVKGPAYGLWGLLAGVCIATDLELWKKKNFYLLAMIDEATQEALGFVHLFEENGIEGKKILVIPGIEPSTEFLGQVKARDLYPLIEEAIERIAIEGGFDAVYLPTSPTIHSNRSDIQQLIKKQDYKKLSLGKSISWSAQPAYPISEVYVMWEKSSSPSSSNSKLLLAFLPIVLLLTSIFMPGISEAVPLSNEFSPSVILNLTLPILSILSKGMALSGSFAENSIQDIFSSLSPRHLITLSPHLSFFPLLAAVGLKKTAFLDKHGRKVRFNPKRISYSIAKFDPKKKDGIIVSMMGDMTPRMVKYDYHDIIDKSQSHDRKHWARTIKARGVNNGRWFVVVDGHRVAPGYDHESHAKFSKDGKYYAVMTSKKNKHEYYLVMGRTDDILGSKTIVKFDKVYKEPWFLEDGRLVLNAEFEGIKGDWEINILSKREVGKLKRQIKKENRKLNKVPRVDKSKRKTRKKVRFSAIGKALKEQLGRITGKGSSGPAFRISGKGLTKKQHKAINLLIEQAFRQDAVTLLHPSEQLKEALLKYRKESTNASWNEVLYQIQSNEDEEYLEYDPEGEYLANGTQVYVISAGERAIEMYSKYVGVSAPVDLAVHAGRSRNQVYYFGHQKQLVRDLSEHERKLIARHEVEHIKNPDKSEKEIKAIAPLPERISIEKSQWYFNFEAEEMFKEMMLKKLETLPHANKHAQLYRSGRLKISIEKIGSGAFGQFDSSNPSWVSLNENAIGNTIRDLMVLGYSEKQALEYASWLWVTTLIHEAQHRLQYSEIARITGHNPSYAIESEIGAHAAEVVLANTVLRSLPADVRWTQIGQAKESSFAAYERGPANFKEYVVSMHPSFPSLDDVSASWVPKLNAYYESEFKEYERIFEDVRLKPSFISMFLINPRPSKVYGAMSKYQKKQASKALKEFMIGSEKLGRGLYSKSVNGKWQLIVQINPRNGFGSVLYLGPKKSYTPKKSIGKKPSAKKHPRRKTAKQI
ncbi:SMP-30/gluconolactonase/LRE family protein [Elusimicrobiota bacterium]